MDRSVAESLLAQAECIYSATDVAAAVERLAAAITEKLARSQPLVLTVMNGGVVFAGQLLPRLGFPLETDYLHATRYGDTTQGGRLEWRVKPRANVHGRTVLVLDDILDAGLTLAAIRAALLEAGAAAVHVAVLAEKDLGSSTLKPLVANFVGLSLPDRYVFGMGMDAYGWWRNLPAIYALPDTISALDADEKNHA